MKTDKEIDKLVQNNHQDYLTIAKEDNSIMIDNTTTTFDLFKGLIYMFFACLFKSLFSVLCKLLLESKADLSSFQLLAYKAYIMAGISIIVAVTSFLLKPSYHINFEITSSSFYAIFLRSLSSIISISLIIMALKFMHISDVFSVYYTYPALVILIAFFFLNEKVGKIDFICLIVCIFGVILIIKPEFLFHLHGKNSDNMYFGIVLFSALLKAIEDVIIRRLKNDISPLIIPFFYSLTGLLLYPIPMIIMNGLTIPSFTLYEMFLLLLISITSFVYQTFMALGLQNENAGRVSMVNYLQVAFMFLSDVFIFKKRMGFLDITGTLMIFCFNFANGVYKTVKRLEYKKNKLDKI